MGPARIAPIQWLRAIAATLVLMMHGGEWIARTPLPIRADFVPSVPNLVTFGASGVDLFFVISGFVMAHTVSGGDGGSWQFLASRWRRIGPFFVLMTMIFLVVADEPFTTRSLLTALTIVPVFDGTHYHAPALIVGWTLAFEFSFYALVAITIRFGRSAGTILLLTLTAGVAGTQFHPDWVPLKILINPLQLEFALGVLVWMMWRSGWTRKLAAPFLVMGIALLAIGIAMSLGLSVNAFFTAAVDGTAGLARTWSWGLPWAMVVAGIIDTRSESRIARVIAKLGDASYATYLIHPSLLIMLAAIAAALPAIGAVGYVLSIIVISSGIGLAVHMVIEKPLLASIRKGPRPLWPRSAARRHIPASPNA
ncbi:acyltransferase [Sphingomonas oligophenolica]|uniref:Acyltransferase n=2 Tax=Sphingomonas oligophenolica TaxID=301154 RepID=A0A502CKX9_9SPHN|nr:acyltransferase [Sphingomonas oligophenolica]